MPTQRPLDEVAIRASFARFRWAALAEGIALLVLVAIMTMKYVVNHGVPDDQNVWATVSSRWSPIHGLIYMVYVVLGFDLWNKMRWKLPRMLLLMFYGIIPVLSFIGERLTRAKVESDLRTRPTLQDSEDRPARDGGDGPTSGTA